MWLNTHFHIKNIVTIKKHGVILIFLGVKLYNNLLLHGERYNNISHD